MDRAQEIARFVYKFLATHGVDARIDEKGLLTAELPVSLAHELGATRQLRLVFSLAEERGEAAEGTAEFITFGHPLLDRMLEMAKARGQATSLLLTCALDPTYLDELHSYDPFRKRSPRASEVSGAVSTSEDDGKVSLDAQTQRNENGGGRVGRLGHLEHYLSRLSFPEASVRSLEKRIVYQTQVMFFFKISLVSDEKRELIVSLLIDPVTEEIDRTIDVSGAVAFRLEHAGGPVQEEYRLDRLYRRACSHLEKRLQKTAREYQEEIDARIRRELQRIEEYYGGLIQERVEPIRKLFRRMAVASVRADLARSWSTENRYRDEFVELKKESELLEAQYEKELASLQREKEQRIREVREKYHARAEVALTHAAFVMVPRVEWRLQLTGRRARRETVLLYDVLRRRLVDWECEGCAGPLGEELHLCDCASLVCSGCQRDCVECGRSFCRACSESSCHICHDPVCPDCATSCPIAAGEVAPSVCEKCRQEWCPECISLSRFHLVGAFEFE